VEQLGTAEAVQPEIAIEVAIEAHVEAHALARLKLLS
jgi:hypothetical protein